jgi:(4-(4-[2-(gamma-L-glutamylamino)ethyl]phenoxymethyl)furan-2-yl)methanamine synthase
MSKTVGWDIGGAHLKMVVLDESGEVQQVLQLPCPLWKGLQHLESAIKDALHAFKIAPSEATNNFNHAVTMTGELVDLFEHRQQGVLEISGLTAKLLGEDTFFYAANNGFVRLERVSEVWASIASTNWHASASALAMQFSDALLVDIGSTTTDIIAISGCKVTSTNLSDAARMADDSLVYTGVVRTPVMALTQKITFEGAEVNVAAEYFATMADVYRLTGELLPEFDFSETADGKGKTTLESARRLARMLGHDVETHSMETWQTLAETCKTVQMQQIKTAVLKHLKPNMTMPNTTILGAGSGSFLVKQIADDLGFKFEYASSLASMRVTGHANFDLKALETCFSAFAVALLAKKQLAQHA